MIDRVDGECRITCDGCGHEEWGGTLEFMDFWREKKGQGWGCSRPEPHGPWEHACPTCKGER